MRDIMDDLAAVHRKTSDAKTPVGPGKTVLLRRTYAADSADVWDALTTGERISRWFLPISGDPRLGGRYQFEGNAGGEVLACEPPSLLRLSWEMGEPGPDTFSEVGVGWDLGLLGLVMYLANGVGMTPEERDSYGQRQQARDYLIASSQAWGVAHTDSGMDAHTAAAAVAATTGFYVPPDGGG